jgi:predicted DNA-binding transcriptional regulator AlpA
MSQPNNNNLPAGTAETSGPSRRTGGGYTLGPHQSFAVPPGAVWITAKQVCARYGGRSLMWLWRKLRDEETFPRPVYFGRLQFFNLEALEAYERTVASSPPPSKTRRREHAEAV